MIRRYLLFLFLFFLFLPSVYGLLVSPAKVELSQYAAGGTEEFDITIINDISEDILIEMSYESWEGKINYVDYFQAVGYENNKVEVLAGESKTVHFILEYPSLEEFGNVRFATVRFYQAPFVSQTENIAATVAVRIPLEVQVPYPEKYVQVEVQEPAVVLPSENTELHAVLTNLGLNVIESVEGSFILLQDGEKKYEFPFAPLTLFVQGESQTVSAVVETPLLEPGRYDLFVEVAYDGEEGESALESFIIGERKVEILEILLDSYTAQSSDTITVSLLNHWVEDVDTELVVDLLDENENLLVSSSLGVYTLPILEKKEISSGFDFGSYSEGDYILRVRAFLDGQEVQKDFAISLVAGDYQPAPEKNSKILFYSIALLVLLLFGIFLYYIYRRRQVPGV